MNLFLDTNIYLSFYDFSNIDLEELKKLLILQQQGRVKLFVPEHVRNELKRNRASKIRQSIDRFENEKLNNEFPQICKGYEEYEQLRALLIEYKRLKTNLREKLLHDSIGGKLKADHIIEKLLSAGINIPHRNEILDRARSRFDLGNPPGKRKSYGDAVNWEALLEDIPEQQDIHFVSADEDYVSDLDKSLFSPFLLDEWETRKKTNLYFFSHLSEFFKSKFPGIKLASELEKELLLADLSTSSSPQFTYQLLLQLLDMPRCNTAQLNQVVTVILSTFDEVFEPSPRRQYSVADMGMLTVRALYHVQVYAALSQLLKGREDLSADLLNGFNSKFCNPLTTR